MHCCSVFRIKVAVPTSEARRQLLGWCFAEADVHRTTIRRILGQIKPINFWSHFEELRSWLLRGSKPRVLVAPFGKIQWGFMTQPFFKWARERERNCKICVPSFRCVTRSSKLTQKMRQLLISSTSFWFNTHGLFAALMKILAHTSQQWLLISGRHGTEEAFALLTQHPWVRISFSVLPIFLTVTNRALCPRKEP